MFCPLEDLKIGLQKCPARCMYNQGGDCRYVRVKECQESLEDSDPRSRVAALAPLIPIKEAQSAVKRIQAFIYTDRYTQYATGKSLDELTPNDFPPLFDSARFYRWPYARPDHYAIIKRVLEIVQSRGPQPTSEKP